MNQFDKRVYDLALAQDGDMSSEPTPDAGQGAGQAETEPRYISNPADEDFSSSEDQAEFDNIQNALDDAKSYYDDDELNETEMDDFEDAFDGDARLMDYGPDGMLEIEGASIFDLPDGRAGLQLPGGTRIAYSMTGQLAVLKSGTDSQGTDLSTSFDFNVYQLKLAQERTARGRGR